MIIITNEDVARIVYSESNWIDAGGSDFGDDAHAYRVPNISVISVLGDLKFNEETSKIEATEPMTREKVEAISIEQLF
jgi:hypothetical protein